MVGTSVNGTLLKPNIPQQLNDKDCIQFGQSTRIYTFDYCKPKKMIEEDSSNAMELKAQLPSGFGSKSNKSNKSSDRDKREAEIAMMTKSMAMPIEPSTRKRVQNNEDDEEGGEMVELNTNQNFKESGNGSSQELVKNISLEDHGRSLGLPISHEITLVGHDKAVLAIALDPAGGRVIGGGVDQKISFWDFGGMDKGHRPFRDIEPQQGYSVVALSFSPSGDRFLCCPTSVHPAIFNKEGAEIIRFVRGDMVRGRHKLLTWTYCVLHLPPIISCITNTVYFYLPLPQLIIFSFLFSLSLSWTCST